VLYKNCYQQAKGLPKPLQTISSAAAERNWRFPIAIRTDSPQDFKQDCCGEVCLPGKDDGEQE